MQAAVEKSKKTYMPEVESQAVTRKVKKVNKFVVKNKLANLKEQERIRQNAKLVKSISEI